MAVFMYDVTEMLIILLKTSPYCGTQIISYSKCGMRDACFRKIAKELCGTQGIFYIRFGNVTTAATCCVWLAVEFASTIGSDPGDVLES